MWPDPFDPKRRRLSFMKGTPTNIYSVLVPAAGVVVVVGLINALAYLPHFQRKIKKIEQDTIDNIPLRQAKAFEMDPLLSGAVASRRLEHQIDKTKDWIDMN